MAHCVNKSHPDFLKLADATNINPIVLAAKISLWQEKNGLDKFPSVQELNIIKPGVEELFNSNPELANEIYQALGFGNFDKTYNYKNEIANKFDADVETIINGMRNVSIADDEDSDINLELKLAEKNGIKYLKYSEFFPPANRNVNQYIFYNDKGKAQAEEIYKLKNIKNPDEYQRQLGYLLQYDLNDVSKFTKQPVNKINRLITSEQKQQALQLYSQYLDSIFPDSKVKDIVYHTNTQGRIEFGTRKEKGLFVTPTWELAKTYKPGPYGKRFQLLIDSNNILELSELELMKGLKRGNENTQKYSEEDYTEYVVFEPKQIHILGGKQDIEGFKEFVDSKDVTIKPVGEDSNLQYQFKVVDKISKNLDKVNKLWKQIGNNNTFWNKIQKDLQIPKDQLELLKESEGNTIEEKLTSFATNYSYTVEINLSVDPKSNQNYGETIERGFRRGNFKYFKNYKFEYIKKGFEENDPQIKISKEEYEEAFNKKENKPTKYYSNLTVPGGTNYTEQELATPAVVPNIKGHAQFATDKGIGWFRSDEQTQTNTYKKKYRKGDVFSLPDQFTTVNGITVSKIENNTWISETDSGNPSGYLTDEEALSLYEKEFKATGTPTKIRRILEVQSDLFQKGRDKEQLIGIDFDLQGGGYKFGSRNQYQILDEKGENILFKDLETGELYEKPKEWLKEQNKKAQVNKSENQFLQLLNKDNNWVTFFTKSIIQDSAKKGYEKVLFPTGNTASKVEGHTTLEEFKKQKEDRIKFLEASKQSLIDNKKEKVELSKQSETGPRILGNVNLGKTVEDFDKEINQLKQELERVEKEGFGALKPIYSFYENNIANILKKQGYNPVQITDEYGNTWNEVTLTEENKEEIYFQQEAQSEEKANKEINNLVTNFLEKLGVSVNSVNEIRDAQGNVISAVAKADMLNKIIDIVEGRADITTLPEEAAHFFVEMLGDNNPLFKDMMSKITSYKIYQETVEQYRNNSQYRNKDGSLNINKLKKEAIGKLISQHIVKNSSNETNANLKTFDSWWSKLWNLIKSIFNKPQTDPFKLASEKILKADISDLSKDNMTETGEYYQLEGIDKLKQHQKDITLDNSIDLKTGQKRHVYTLNGKDIKSSVTSKYVDAWLKRKYPFDNRSETQKKLDLVKAEYGDIVHKIMEDILDSYIDPETNLVRPVPIESVNKNSDSAPYKMLEKYVVDLIAEYNKPGTLFMKEVKIYDPVKDVAGSIDLLIITPTGEASIYDWKSQEIGKDQTEIKQYKEIISRIQLQEYKKILETHYGIKEFNLVRAIPIKTSFKYKGSGTSRVIDSLTSLEIGNFDPSLIPDTKNYLLPITLRDEKTDDKELSSYIKKLNSVMDILENKKYKTDEERKRKKLELNKYKNAVRDLQLRGDVRKFIELGNFEINKYKKMISDNAILPKDALESLEILKLFSNTTNVFNLYMNKLKKIKKDTDDKNVINAVDQIINDYNQMNSTADVVLNDMQNAIKEMASKFAQQKTGITDLLEPETDIDTLSATFNSLSTIDKKAFRVFSRMLGDAQNKRDNLFNKDFEELIALKKEYTEWAKSKGLSDKDLFKPLLNYNDKNEWTGAFVKKYQSEFYDKMTEAIQSDNVKWLIDNTEFNQEKFDESKKRQKEFYDSLVYDSKDKENNKKLQKQAYETWLLNHDVNIGGLNKNKQAYLNMDNYNGKKTLNSYLKPKEKWFSKQWKELSSNPVALKTYNYFQDLLKRSAKAGVIDEYSPAFIPNIFRNKLEQFVFGGDTFSKKGFFESFEVESGESPYAPQINPITGAIEHSIPTHFIRDIGVEREDGSIDYSQKSMDLFRVFGIWSAQLANYEAMSEIEDEAKILLFAENNKKHIETDNFNNPVFEGGVLKEIPGNKINSELLETFMNFYFYNKQSGKIEDKKIKIGDKQYSGSKAVGWLVRFFSLKTLALNPLSGTANFVGGTGNAFFQASKGILFNTSDWASSMYDVTKRDEIAWGLLGISDVLIEDQKDSKLNKLSVSKVINANTIDKAFVLMRASDRAVQYPVAIALMKNNMVDENGKIVDIQTYVKAKYNYNEEFYKLPKTEQNIIRKKIEEEVTQLKENKSIYKTAKIVNDKIEIPGVDLNSEAWGRFRLKIKKVNKSILGNSSRDDINRIKTNMLGSMAMQFRSWMPQMIQERFGKLKYDQDLEVHTIGKFNLWISELFSKRAVSLLSGIISSGGTNMIEAAREKYLILKAEAIDKGEEFNITEGEFVDLYIGNIRSMYREFLVILGIGALMFTALSGDDDDEDEDKGWKAYAGRAFRKYFDEFSFFYSARSWTALVNTPLPIAGLAEDFGSFIGATFSQSYGFVLNDEDIMEDAKPAKYLSKMMPIFKEGIQMRAIFDEDFRKDWGIRFNASNR